ncbi:MAG TPA: 50S ribosomal protein L18 [Candidatus Bipolaricaulota bacterium]
MSIMNRQERLQMRHRRVRGRVMGTPQRSRLSVHKSLRYLYAQIIDDVAGVTLVSASTLEPELRKKRLGPNQAGARQLGELIAKRAQEKGIKAVVFDRGGYLYHGVVAALAEAARKHGLEF